MIRRCESVAHRGWIEMREQHLVEMAQIVAAPRRLVALVAAGSRDNPIGIAEVSLRVDYVNGTSSDCRRRLDDSPGLTRVLPGVEHALPAMTTVASRNLVATDASRGVFTVRLVIGQPYRVAENEWACSIALDGLYEHLWDQHGVDSFQALMQAQNLARTLLSDFVTNGGVLLNVPGGVPIDVNQLFASGEMT